MADDVAVMYMGKIVEKGDVDTIFNRPLHPYTVGLMRSIPELGQRNKERLTPIPGSVPDPFLSHPAAPSPPAAPRRNGPHVTKTCRWWRLNPEHWGACTLYEE
ncbi:MAG: hypothetical protein R2856_01285 [Caldilineaceae bacterium]